MAKIRPLDSVARKWQDVTPTRQDYYRHGVEHPKKDWAEETAAAESAYKEGVTKAANEGRFGKGVSMAGTEKWKAGAMSKGVNRWPEGVRAAGDNYKKGFAPYHAAISSVDLGPRYPKGDPRNYERVAKIGQTLHNTKLEKYGK